MTGLQKNIVPNDLLEWMRSGRNLLKEGMVIPIRTLLFAPGNRIDRVKKAVSLDADAASSILRIRFLFLKKRRPEGLWVI